MHIHSQPISCAKWISSHCWGARRLTAAQPTGNHLVSHLFGFDHILIHQFTFPLYLQSASLLGFLVLVWHCLVQFTISTLIRENFNLFIPFQPMSTRTDWSLAHFNQGYFMAHYLSSGTQELGLAGPVLTLHCSEEQTQGKVSLVQKKLSRVRCRQWILKPCKTGAFGPFLLLG